MASDIADNSVIFTICNDDTSICEAFRWPWDDTDND